LELVDEKERMNELNLPEEAIEDKTDDEIFEIYNNRVMNQEEVIDYREVQEEEELHTIEKPDPNNEIVIIMKPIENPLFPVADENNYGDDET
jgi:tellurite resistance protein